jgi:heme-degrading monooxygenase HmoA
VVPRTRRPSVADQARERGTRPIESADTYALLAVWESDDEVEAFIEFTHAARQAE